MPELYCLLYLIILCFFISATSLRLFVNSFQFGSLIAVHFTPAISAAICQLVKLPSTGTVIASQPPGPIASPHSFIFSIG